MSYGAMRSMEGGAMRKLFFLMPALVVLAGCSTTSQPQPTMDETIAAKCTAFGFKAGTDQFANCQLQLTQAMISSRPSGGAPLIVPPSVNFEPLPMPQSYGTQRVQVQANCTSYGTGMFVNTSCY